MAIGIPEQIDKGEKSGPYKKTLKKHNIKRVRKMPVDQKPDKSKYFGTSK